MSEVAPTKTEINLLFQNWLSTTQGAEDYSAPLTTNETQFLVYQLLTSPASGLNKLSNDLAAALNGTSSFLANLLQQASDAAASGLSLLDRTGELAGGSGFGFADLAPDTTLVSELQAILAAIAEARWFLHEWVNEKGDHIITNILTNRGENYQHYNWLMGALVERRNELQTFISERQAETHTVIGEQPVIVTDYVLARHGEVIAALAEARLWVPGQVNANTDLRATDLTFRLDTRADQLEVKVWDKGEAVLVALASDDPAVNGAIGAIPAAVKLDADAQTAAILLATNAIPAAVKLDADLQTAWVLDHVNERVTPVVNGARDAVIAAMSSGPVDVVGPVNAARDYVADRVTLVALDVATNLAAINAIPAAVKLDADGQTAFVLDNVADRIRPDGEAQRDYVVAQGEAQRDYVAAQVAQVQWDVTLARQSIGQVAPAVKLDADAQTAFVLDNVADRIRPDGEAQRDLVVSEVQIARDAIRAEQDAALVVLNSNAGKLDLLLNADQTGYTVIQDFEVPFSGIERFDYGADVYQIQIDQLPPGRPRIDLGGDHEYLPHAGWCALNVLGGWERGPLLEFSINTVTAGKLRPQGILLYTKPGTTGVLRGYEYSQTP